MKESVVFRRQSNRAQLLIERPVRERNQGDSLDLWFERWHHFLLRGRWKKSRVVRR